MHLIFKLKIIHVKIFRGVKFSQFHLIRKILMVLTAKLFQSTSSAHFLTKGGSLSIVCSPVPFSFLRWLGTSDTSLRKVQVASSLDFCSGKYVFMRLLPGNAV